MSSDEVIALATDALRGQLLSVLPADASVIVGAPSPEGQAVLGLLPDAPRRDRESVAELLPQPERLAALSLRTMRLHWVGRNVRARRARSGVSSGRGAAATNVFPTLVEKVKAHRSKDISHALYDVDGEYWRNM